MWGKQLRLSFYVVGNGLSWAMKVRVQSSLAAALPHGLGRQIPLRHNQCEVFFLDTRAYVFDYGSSMEGENKPSDSSKTEKTHSRYKDTGLKCSRVLWGLVYSNLRDKIFCCVLFGYIWEQLQFLICYKLNI